MQQFSREQTVFITASALILGTVALATALSYTASAAMPLVLAFMVSYLIGPLVDSLQIRLELPRPIAIFTALFFIGGAAFSVAILLMSSLASLAASATQYEQQLSTMLHDSVMQIEQWLPGLLPEGLIDDTGVVLDSALLQPVYGVMQSTAAGLLQVLSQLLSNATLVTIMAMYLVAGRKPLQVRSGMLGEIESQIRTYLGTKVMTSAATGVITWLILMSLGLDLAVMFGFLAFLLNFIPTFGSLVATILPLPLAVLEFSSAPWKIAAAILIPGTCQFVIGNVLEPKIMGDNLKLHPVTILVNLVFWGILWGPMGMLLATPLAAVIRIVLSRFETTRPIASMMAGQPMDESTD